MTETEKQPCCPAFKETTGKASLSFQPKGIFKEMIMNTEKGSND